MTDKLDPDAWASTGDSELDARDGVQEVDTQMIFEWVITEHMLPDYSARHFAEWLHENWNDFAESADGLVTNRSVIHGAVTEWCGGRTA